MGGKETPWVSDSLRRGCRGKLPPALPPKAESIVLKMKMKSRTSAKRRIQKIETLLANPTTRTKRILFLRNT